MTRPGRTNFDRFLLYVLVPFWAFCQVLHVDRQLAERPIAWVPLYVAPATVVQALPSVLALWPGAPDAPGVAPGGGVEVGDALQTIGDTALTGAGRVGVIAASYEATSPTGAVQARVVRNGVIRDVVFQLALVPAAWSHLLLSLSVGISAVLVLLRGRVRRASRAYALAALAFSLHFTSLHGGSPATTYFGVGLLIASAALYPPLLVRAALFFPESAIPRSRLARGAPWLLLGTGPAFYVFLLGAPSLGLRGFQAVSSFFALAIASTLAVAVRNYAAADARPRRQMRWALYGLFVGMLPPALIAFASMFDPAFRGLYERSLVSQVLIPVFFVIALVRYDLYDVDRLISATATWTLLGVVGLAGVLTLGQNLAAWAAEYVGGQEATWTWGIALLSAAPIPLVAPRLRPNLERLLFRERALIVDGLRALRSDVGDADSAGALLSSLTKQLDAVLGLTACAVYGRTGDKLISVGGHGPLIPPTFDADGALALAVADAAAPLRASRWQQWARRGVIGHEAAALESMDARVLIPLFRGQELAGLLCLGEKRSGDVFTTTDLAQLEALAERVSLQLESFDRQATEREQREIYEALANYAPAAIAEALRGGRTIEPGEREVSVLFVDIRGYTPFSQQHTAPEVFEMVTRYVDAVSRQVLAQGGAVVEFQGDGLLAVFGALGNAEDKERRAVEAARGIAKSVDQGDLAEGAPLSCGIGIATGPAFVGYIDAVDRQLFNVIGNTVNLASRYEGLTRDLNVSIVIDDLTRSRCGEAIDDFTRREGVRVKGRDESFLLWTKPLLDRASPGTSISQ